MTPPGLPRRGWPRSPSVADGASIPTDRTAPALARALDALDVLDAALTDEALDSYATTADGIAQREFAHFPASSRESAARDAVVLTVLIEPVLLTLRRLAHENLSTRRFSRRAGLNGSCAAMPWPPLGLDLADVGGLGQAGAMSDSMQRTYPAGVTSWIDVESADLDASADFYRGLLGWETEQVTPPGAPERYLVATVGGLEVAGGGGSGRGGRGPVEHLRRRRRR